MNATIKTDLSAILSDLASGNGKALPLMNKAKKLLKELGQPAPNGTNKDKLISILESITANDTDKTANDTDKPDNFMIATGYASGTGHQLYQVGLDTYQAIGEDGAAVGEVIPGGLYSQMVALGMLSKYETIKTPTVIFVKNEKDYNNIPVQYYDQLNGEIKTCKLGDLGSDTSPARHYSIDDKPTNYGRLEIGTVAKKLAYDGYLAGKITLTQYQTLTGIKPIKQGKGKKVSYGQSISLDTNKQCLSADQKYKRYRAALVKAKLECQTPSFQALLDKMANGGVSIAELKRFQDHYDMKKTHINSITSHLKAMPMGYNKDGDMLTLTTSVIPND